MIKPFIFFTLLCSSLMATAQSYTAPQQVTNLPTLYIQTNSGRDPVDKENYLPCTIKWVENGTVKKEYTLTSAAGGGIRGRGNSTWALVKKPWRIKFDKKEKFLGDDFAKAKNWTLLANSFDKTLMRNALTYHLGKFMEMDFCPCYKFVDLVLNGTYRGTYQVSDQMEVKEKRVFLENEDTDWLLEYANSPTKVDEPKIDFIINNKSVGWVQVKNPEFENDNLNSNRALATQIRSYLNDIIAPRISTNKTGYEFLDPRNGYRSVVDTTSLINWYVAQETTWNFDGLYSIYVYRTADGPLHFGPLWDNDLAYGMNSQQYNINAGAVVNRWDEYYYDDQVLLAFSNFPNLATTTNENYRKLHVYIAHLFDDPWFANAVKMRFDELVAAGLEDYLLGKIDMLETELQQSAAKNFQRWRIYDYPYADNYYNEQTCGDFRCYVNVEYNYSWTDYINTLRTFIHQRLATLKTEFAARANGTKGSKVWYVDEQQQNVAADGWSTNVVMRRPFVSGTWNTMCLPFNLTAQEIEYMFGEGTVVEEFNGVTRNEGKMTLNFKKVRRTITAGKPYLVKPTRDVTVPFAFLNKYPIQNAQTVTYDGCSFVGTFAPIQLKADGTQLFVGSGNKLYRPSASSAKMKGLRAYFDINQSDASLVKAIAFDQDEAMGIENIMADDMNADNRIFTVSGQYIGTDRTNLSRGIYVIGGKKVMIK